METDVAQALAFAVSTATAAGEVLLHHDTGRPQAGVRMKGTRDPVTEADLESERLIVEAVRSAWPGAAVVAEEGAHDVPSDRRTVFIDPLDGTVNFSQGHPFFCVSIAVWEAGRPWLGVVHAPRLGETFAAGEGLGATRNGEPMHVSSRDRLIDSVLATGFCYERNEVEDDNVGHFSDLVLKVRGLRRCGSAALDLAYVASGRLDGFWEPHLNAWDVAAGAVLVREAGGTVTDMTGGDDWLFGGTITAAGPALHPVLLDALRSS